MRLRHKIFYAVAGFVLGNLMLAALASGVFFLNKPQSSEIDFRQAASRLQNGDVRSVNISSAAQSPFDRLLFQLFRILFILFLVSPPIIVVLLLVIIRKMDERKSLK